MVVLEYALISVCRELFSSRAFYQLLQVLRCVRSVAVRGYNIYDIRNKGNKYAFRRSGLFSSCAI